MAFGAHARVDQDLRDRVLRSRAFLALVGGRQVPDVVDRMVVADVLQGVGDGLDEIFLLDGNRGCAGHGRIDRSEEHTSELQSLMRISYAVFCLKKKQTQTQSNK